MSDPYLRDPIQPLDVAVVDQDLLWRVELMNAVRPLYADDFADVASVPDRVHPDDPTVVLLGRGLTDNAVAELLDLRATRANIAVVAVASAIVPATGLAGVDHVLPADITDEELAGAVVEYVEERRGALPELPVVEGVEVDTEQVVADARLVLVTSAKGGVGRTTVALNLAAALAQQGVSRNVALVETDPIYGDLGMMLGLTGPGVRTSIGLESLTDQIVLSQCTFPVGHDRFDVVLPPQPPDPWTPLTPDEVTVLVGAVALDHDWIVVDVSPHVLRDTALTALADAIYVVAPTELSGLKNATILAAALRQRVPFGHLLEMVVVDREGLERKPEVVADASGTPVAASVPHDHWVATAIERQRPLVEVHPRGGASRALRDLAEHTFRALGTPTETTS